MFTLESDHRQAACRHCNCIARELDAELDYYIRGFSLTVDMNLVLSLYIPSAVYVHLSGKVYFAVLTDIRIINKNSVTVSCPQNLNG